MKKIYFLILLVLILLAQTASAAVQMKDTSVCQYTATSTIVAATVTDASGSPKPYTQVNFEVLFNPLSATVRHPVAYTDTAGVAYTVVTLGNNSISDFMIRATDVTTGESAIAMVHVNLGMACEIAIFSFGSITAVAGLPYTAYGNNFGFSSFMTTFPIYAIDPRVAVGHNGTVTRSGYNEFITMDIEPITPGQTYLIVPSTESIKVVVAAPDPSAPMIMSKPTLTVEPFQSYTYDVDAVSPVGATLTYSLESPPTNMTIDSATGLIYWLPATYGGVQVIKINVTDGVRSTYQHYRLAVLLCQTSADCDDNNACTSDLCNPTAGCVHTPIACDDNNVCTTDSCDLATGCVHAAAQSGWAITTVAGNGTSKYSGDNGPATSANLSLPTGVAMDSSGAIYIVDTYNNRIRKVDTAGIITTVAGNGTAGYSGDNGPATSASLNSPYDGIAVDSSGNIYIADTYNNRVRKVDTGGIIITVAGNGTRGYSGDNGPAASASLNYPYGVAVASTGDIYIADLYNNRIRKVDTGGTITTMAGNGTAGYSGDNGPATSAILNSPSGVTVDSSGNLYIADMGNHRVRKVDAGGTITTVAGNDTRGYSGDNGPATSAALHSPSGAAVDSSGNIYIADKWNHRIRQVDASGIITTMAGNGSQGDSGDNGPATAAILDAPSGVAVDSSGNIYIADSQNARIRKIAWYICSDPCTGQPDGTLCNDGNACTTNDVCSTGTCKGTSIVCNDFNACTIDTCNPGTGCVYTPIICNDNNACTADSCNPASGCVFAPVDCNPDRCSSITCGCDPGSGCICPAVLDYGCNDFNACTVDTCDPAIGCFHTTIICDDNNTCTTDVCDAATGCRYTPLPDQTACTVNSQPGTCTAGACIAAPICNGVKSVTIRGGGQKAGTVDLQIQTNFTVVNGGCIAGHTDSTVTCTPGTNLLVDVKAGKGPMPTSCTWKGVPISTDMQFVVACPAVSGDVGKLICDNKLGGGKDSDKMTITVQ